MFTSTLTAAETNAAQAMTVHAIARRQSVENAPGYQAKGKALADLVIAEARTQAGAWKRYYRSLLELESEGRKAFRSALNAHMKAMQGHVVANSPNGKDDLDIVFAGAKRSAAVRLSQFNTISRALDLGVEMDKDWPIDYAVSFAREFLRSQSAGDKRGRPAKPWLDKVKEFLSKTVPEGEMSTCLELVETMAALKASPEA